VSQVREAGVHLVAPRAAVRARGCDPLERRRHLQAGVGHSCVLSGRRRQRKVHPFVRTMILASD
jgi:poly-beta-hydroxyalkanoate depolymerase